jgi:arylsulfatase
LVSISSLASIVAATAALSQSVDPETGAVVARSYADSKEGKTPPLKVARGAPNVIWILLDDAGWGATSAFGGPVSTPTFDRLANSGLRYTNFHTTGVCAPTRAALLTGRNHNAVAMGLFPHPGLSAEFPGYSGRILDKDGMIAQYLHAAGYSTYQLGKWHLTPDREMSNLGPYDRWPVGKGFDHSFGFLGGADDQYTPDLVEDRTHVAPDGRHLNAQLMDKAMYYIDQQERVNPEKPFFMYIATGATHAPHQSDRYWLNKWRGKFDMGWDVVRQQTFERQKKMGLIPKDAVLPDRDPLVPAWSSLSPDEKLVYARLMESYAAFMESTDYEIGRLVDYLKAHDLDKNTAIFLVLGDNGASKEGRENGSIFNEISYPDKHATVPEMLKDIDKIGTSATFSNYPIGWGQAMDTPFRKWKGDADSEGGTRNPLIVSWPTRVPAGEIRMQYGHVIDLLPTTLEIAHVPQAETINGLAQTPIQGTSLAYSFNDAKAANRHRQQYYFLFGDRAMVKDGWKAAYYYYPNLEVIQANPKKALDPNADHGHWELFNLNNDFNERIDVAAKYPEKLKELTDLFEEEAKKNNVYPLINASDLWGRFNVLMRAGHMGPKDATADGAKRE